MLLECDAVARRLMMWFLPGCFNTDVATNSTDVAAAGFCSRRYSIHCNRVSIINQDRCQEWCQSWIYWLDNLSVQYDPGAIYLVLEWRSFCARHCFIHTALYLDRLICSCWFDHYERIIQSFCCIPMRQSFPVDPSLTSSKVVMWHHFSCSTSGANISANSFHSSAPFSFWHPWWSPLPLPKGTK